MDTCGNAYVYTHLSTRQRCHSHKSLLTHTNSCIRIRVCVCVYSVCYEVRNVKLHDTNHEKIRGRRDVQKKRKSVSMLQQK